MTSLDVRAHASVPMSAARWSKPPYWTFFLGACIIGALCVVSPLDRDEGAFLVIAQEILHGRIPYRDVFDQKPPGIYYLLAGLLALTKPLSITTRILTLRLFATLANALSAVGLLELGKHWWQRDVGRLADLFWLATCALPYFGANQLFTEPFATAALIWAAVRLTRRTHYRAMLEAGLLLAISTLFKQPSILATPAFALLIYTQTASTGAARLRSSVAHFGVMLLGVAVPWLLVLGAYWAAGGLGALWYQVFIVNIVGYPTATGGRQMLLFITLLLAVSYSGPLVVAVRGRRLGASIAGALRSQTGARVCALALLAASFAVPMVVHPYLHYFIQVLPWVALLIAAAVYAGNSRVSSDQSPESFAERLTRAASPALIAAPLIVALALSLQTLPTAWAAFSRQIVIGQRIDAETPPEASLLVAPAEPEFYYLSGRLPTTPFVYLLPVDIPDFPLAQATNDIRTKQFDVVVWSTVPPSSRMAPRYAAMLHTLERAYHAGPVFAPSMILFTR